VPPPPLLDDAYVVDPSERFEVRRQVKKLIVVQLSFEWANADRLP